MTQLLTFGKPLLHTTELNSTENRIALGEIPNDLPLICLMDSWASYCFLQSCQSPGVLGYVPRTLLESQIAVTGFCCLNDCGRNNYFGEEMVSLPREGNAVVWLTSTFQQSKLLLLIWHLKRCYLLRNLFCLRICVLMLKVKLRSP